jgi:hypothetical protein
VLDPLDPRMFGSYIRHDNDIETDAHSSQVLTLLQQLARSTDESPLLPDADAGRSATVGVATSSSHLSDDKDIPLLLARNDVELTEAAAVISLENFQAPGP